MRATERCSLLVVACALVSVVAMCTRHRSWSMPLVAVGYCCPSQLPEFVMGRRSSVAVACCWWLLVVLSCGGRGGSGCGVGGCSRRRRLHCGRRRCRRPRRRGLSSRLVVAVLSHRRMSSSPSSSWLSSLLSCTACPSTASRPGGQLVHAAQLMWRTTLTAVMAASSSVIILVSGARGPRLNSRSSPSCFLAEGNTTSFRIETASR